MASNSNDKTLHNTEAASSQNGETSAPPQDGAVNGTAATSPQNGENAALLQNGTVDGAADASPTQNDEADALSQDNAGGVPDINDDIDGPYNGNWDEKKVDLDNLLKEFKEKNISVIDKNPAFWVTIFVFFVIIMGLFIAGVCVFFSQDPPKIPENCLQSAEFWYVVIQKIGFIVCVLFVFMPLLKLFFTTIGMINKSQENKSIRMVQTLRFCYVLKYLGKIDSELMKPLLGEEEIQEKKKNSEEDISVSTKEIANLLKKIEPITKWFVDLVRK